MATTQSAPPQRARSADRILAAARQLLAERGYSALTIEAVAATAGVGKATIYRWWPGKEALLADALAETFLAEEIPDLGDTAAELRRAVDLTIANYTGDALTQALPALAVDCARDPQLLARFRDGFLRRKRAHITAALRRAVTRGDLPAALDAELVQDLWAGTVLYRRVLMDAPVDADLADRLVRLVLQAPEPFCRPETREGR